MKDIPTPTFGEQTKAWREYFGWSKTDLAARAGMTPEAVVMWESGATQRASLKNETRVIEAFGLTRAQFWGPVPSKPEAA